MRLIKMLGLAAVTAIAAMAFLGAGTASATLCKAKESPCSAANQYPEHTTIVVLSKNAILKGNGFSGTTVECHSEATLLHEVTHTSGTWYLLGKVTSLVWSACKGCTSATTTTLPTFEDRATGSGNGEILLKNTTVKLSGCPLGASCVATAEDATMPLTGGTINGTAKGTANNIKVKMSGFGCGTEGTWNAGGGSGGEPYIVKSVNGLTTGSVFIE
jgi:hypothetical protein